jgi:hypothetical protein
MPVVNLFRDGDGYFTLPLWAITFLNLVCAYFLANWLPVLMNSAGPTSRQSSAGSACRQAWLRHGALLKFLVAAVFIVAIGHAASIASRIRLAFRDFFRTNYLKINKSR